MRFIDSKTHGFLDYASGILFIASPWLFDFTTGDTAMWVPIVVGIIVLVMSLMTKYEMGAVYKIPFVVHLNIDVITGIFLIASPWIFGFAEVVKWPHVIFGILALGAGLFTKKNVQSPQIDI